MTIKIKINIEDFLCFDELGDCGFYIRETALDEFAKENGLSLKNEDNFKEIEKLFIDSLYYADGEKFEGSLCFAENNKHEITPIF